MAGTVTHKHKGIVPSTPTPKTTDVDGANWLEEHEFNAPEIGAVLVGDPSESDKVGWVSPGTNPNRFLRSNGAGQKPTFEDAPALSAHDLLSATHPDTLADGVQRGAMIVGSVTPKWEKVNIGLDGSVWVSNGVDPSWQQFLALGLGHAQLGVIRIPNDAWIAARNLAGGADINMFKVDPNDRIAAGAEMVLVGDGTQALSAVTKQQTVEKAIGTTKGDIIGFTANATPARKGVGADGSLLVADSTQADGLKWTKIVKDVDLPIGEALPDGTGSNNAPAELRRRVSGAAQTAGTPKVTEIVAHFDATAYEALMASFTLPLDYDSGGVIVIQFSMATAAGGNILARVGVAIDDVVAVTNTTLKTFSIATLDNQSVPTFGAAKEISITLSTTSSGSTFAPGRKCVFFIHLGTATTSNHTGDRILESWRFRYNAKAALA